MTTATYGEFKPTAFDHHLDIDWEPSEALEAAREKLEKAKANAEEAENYLSQLYPDGDDPLDDAGVTKALSLMDEAQKAVDALEAVEDRNNWLLVPVGRNRDSGPLEESNFEAALETLGGESETVEVHRFSHWGPGWFEIIICHPSRLKDVEDVARSLEDYPVLNDEDHSSRERDATQEDWDNWGEWDFRKAVMSELESICEDAEDQEAAWARHDDIVTNWLSANWNKLFSECDGEMEHTGTESIFTYDAYKCAKFAFENDLSIEE